MLPSSRAPPKHIHTLLFGLDDYEVETKLLVGNLEENLLLPRSCEVKKGLDLNISFTSFIQNVLSIRKEIDAVDLVYVPISTPMLITASIANIPKKKLIISGPNIQGVFSGTMEININNFSLDSFLNKIPILTEKIYEINILSDYFISFTYYQKRLLSTKGLCHKKISVINHPVNINNYTPAKKNDQFWKKFGISNEIIILFTGRLIQKKGILDLLEAFKLISKRYSNISLAICGSGELERVVFKVAKKIKNAHYLGFLSEKELQIAYASADIGVFPSKYEPFGLVYLESMASGLPTIGVDTSGPSEIISDGFDGILIPDNHPKSIIDALETLITNNNLRKKMGKRARLKIEKNYSPSVIAKKYLDLFDYFVQL